MLLQLILDVLTDDHEEKWTGISYFAIYGYILIMVIFVADNVNKMQRERRQAKEKGTSNR